MGTFNGASYLHAKREKYDEKLPQTITLMSVVAPLIVEERDVSARIGLAATPPAKQC